MKIVVMQVEGLEGLSPGQIEILEGEAGKDFVDTVTRLGHPDPGIVQVKILEGPQQRVIPTSLGPGPQQRVLPAEDDNPDE